MVRATDIARVEIKFVIFFLRADRVELVGTAVGRERVLPDIEGRQRVRDRKLRHRRLGGHRRLQRDDQPAGLRRVPVEPGRQQRGVRVPRTIGNLRTKKTFAKNLLSIYTTFNQ